MRPVAALIASLPDAPLVLDAGCGDGLPVLSRLQRDGAPVGLDASRAMLRSARANVPGVALVQGELRAIPLATGSVDAVVARHSIVHVPVPDHPTVIAEFARVLGPGGRLLVSEGAPAGVPTRDPAHGDDPLHGPSADPGDGGGTGSEEYGATVAGLALTRDQLVAAGLAVEEEWPADGGERGFLLARCEPTG